MTDINRGIYEFIVIPYPIHIMHNKKYRANLAPDYAVKRFGKPETYVYGEGDTPNLAIIDLCQKLNNEES